MAAAQNELTSEQMDKLLQFQDLTGIDDFDRCRNILNSHAWNLESAAHDQFNEPTTPPPPPPLPPPRDTSPLVNFNPSNQRLFIVPRHTVPRSWSSLAFETLLFPLRFVYSSLYGIFSFVFYLFRSRPRMVSRRGELDVAEFIGAFEKSYGVKHPPLYPGSYNQALDEAKRSLRFMLVYLHSPSHQDVPVFVRNTLCTDEFIQLVQENNLLFWACSVHLAEGYKVSQYIRERTYPFLAFIVLKDNRMTVVARIEGNHGKDDLISELNDLMRTQRPSLVRVQREREERNLTVTLRQQQDEAYEQSLMADREKDRKKREKEEERVKETRLKREDEERVMLMERRRAEQVELLKESLRKRLPWEPDPSHPDAIRVLFKLPSGKRLERSFKKNDSLQFLYDFLLVYESCPDNFQIFTPHPRQLIPCFNHLQHLQTLLTGGSGSSDGSSGSGSDGGIRDYGGENHDTDEVAGVVVNGADGGGGLVDTDAVLRSEEVLGELRRIPTFEAFGLQKAQLLHVHDVDK